MSTIVPPDAPAQVLPEPYYSDDRSVDCVITDPPYSDRTHEGTRSNSDRAKGHGNRVLSGTFGFDSRVAQNEGHPTSKPLPMIADWVRLFTNPGDLILDPFAGSGTTLRAAKDEGRRALGVELDERYCEVIAKRLSQDTLFGGVA